MPKNPKFEYGVLLLKLKNFILKYSNFSLRCKAACISPKAPGPVRRQYRPLGETRLTTDQTQGQQGR